MSLTVTEIGEAFDSRAECVDVEGESSLIASCDIYEFMMAVWRTSPRILWNKREAARSKLLA
jgi:hypothetical protein